MHRVLLPFEFFEPKTVDEAVRLLDTANSKVMAGGVDLVLKMRLRLTLPDAVIGLQKIPGLDYIESNPAGLRFGALASIRQIELSPLVREKLGGFEESRAQNRVRPNEDEGNGV